MKYCPNCGKELTDEMKFCGRCGSEQKKSISAREIKKTNWKGFLLILIAVMAVGILAIGARITKDDKNVNEVADESKIDSDATSEVKKEQIGEKNIEDITGENDDVTEQVSETGTENSAAEEYDELYKLIEVQQQWFDENGNIETEYMEIHPCNEKGEYLNGELRHMNFDGSVLKGDIKYDYNEDGTYLTRVEWWDGYINEILRDNRENTLNLKKYDGDGTLYYEEWFGDDGNILSERGYNNEGILIYETLYDSSGNEIETNWPEGAESYYLDKNGEKIEIRTYKEENSYDEHGNLRECICYDSAGKRNSYGRWENSYDEYGNLIEAVGYDGNDELFYRKNMSYDERGNLIMHIEHDITGKMIVNEAYQYQYDGQGNMLSKKHYSEGKIKLEEKYDIQGNVIESLSYDESGVFYDKIVRTYDEHGNLLTTYQYDGDDHLYFQEELKYQAFKIT